MINTQTQIDSLIDLAVLQRTELKQLVDSLPQLRDHLSSEIERNLEEIEPAIRSELEQFVAARALDTQAKTSAELSAKLDAMARNLESTTAAKYSVLMAERAQNATLLAQAEARIAEAASALPGAVKGIVTDELARFPRAGEIDQLRKEFAEPRGLNPRGRWQVGETYNKLDLVSYNGDSYVSNTNGNREKPSRSSEAWTLSAARGNGGAGGGVTSLTDLVAVPANGELLIGNGSAFVNNTLTAGTGVTITNGPGTITIDASGAQEILTATVTNAESVAITRGQVVYLFGATGNRASVKLADNSNDAASSKTFGVVSEASIAAGANGLVTCVGVVDKLTLGSYTEGDVLYLGATPGAVTNVKPYAPNHLVYVGMVERANNGNGELYVRIQNGFELDEIHDVQITTPPLAGSLLMRDATNSLWKANRLTGTANQVTVTNADTSVTLSLPTAIANVNSVTAATTQNLTLAGGSTGASLVLGQGANANASVAPAGTGSLIVTKNSTGNNVPGIILKNGAAGYTELDLYSGVSDTVKLLLQASDVNSFAAVSVGTNHPLLFGINGSERMRIATTGNLLIGTTTDGGQKLQVAGDIISNSTSGSNIIANDPTFNHPVIQLKEASVNKAAFESVSGDAYLSTQTAGKSLYLRSGNATTALTLASNQAATFAGAVTVSGTSGGLSNLITGNSSSGNYSFWDANSSPLASDGYSILNLRAFSSLTGSKTQIFGIDVSKSGAGTDNAAKVFFNLHNGTNLSPFMSVSAARDTTFAGAVTTGGAINVTNGGGTFVANSGSNSNQTALSLTNGGAGGTNYQIQTSTSAGTTAGGLLIYDNNAAAAAISIAGTSRNVGILSTTPSTGAGSGALQVAGGIYSGANSYFTAQITSARPFMATGSIAANMTSAGGIGFAGGGANVFSFGANASTTGAFSVQLVSSDASLNFNALTIAANTGAATFAGTVIAPAATTAISSVRLPHGTAPTSPVNGDMWTTTAGLYVRINGVTVGPLS